MADAFPNGDEIVDSIKNAAGTILGVSENRCWVEFFFEGDLMHTKTVNLPAGSVFDIYIEEIPHKVVAKGRGYLADKIIEIAREHNIPIRQDKNLLQILSRLDLNDEIPT